MSQPLSRRQALRTAACGFGYLAFAGLSGQTADAPAPHFKARAKRIIFLFMQGGVSHVDSFDYKPRLERDDGKTHELRRRPRPRQHGHARLVATRHEAAVEIRTTRPVRPLGVRAVPRNQPPRRRPLLHPFDADRRRCARTGDAVPPLRLDQPGPPVDGFVGALWPRLGKRQPARIRVDLSIRGQWRTAQLRQRLPARRVPGHAAGKGGKSGQRCDHSQPHQPAVRSATRSGDSSICFRPSTRISGRTRRATRNWKRSSSRTNSPGRCSRTRRISSTSRAKPRRRINSTASATPPPTTSAASA